MHGKQLKLIELGLKKAEKNIYVRGEDENGPFIDHYMVENKMLEQIIILLLDKRIAVKEGEFVKKVK